MNVKRRENFLETLQWYYAEHGRHDLPWRLPEADGSFDPYKILVSELMLQQTQVPRVVPKYEAFLEKFPTIQTLAIATLGDVLIAWQGLGYNRRAKFLWQAAQKIMQEFHGAFPRDELRLRSLPGVGANTAGAIRAYAFNEPTVFIETNIRTVYIHHFFSDEWGIPDPAIRDLVDTTLDRINPRVFYWSLMDYGSYLKQSVGNVSRASTTYAKQSKFSGSTRQIRGRILRLLAAGRMPEAALHSVIDDERAEVILDSLTAEGLVQKTAGYYRLP